ncbi:MAG: hypothetical protein KAR44_05605 [Candidatus Aegiribacteria sp.]|nr:hypothetical protein [Candidatus Aegiribacteria sp.]
MNVLITALVLAGLQDPSAVTIAVQDSLGGLLCSDGRHAGLYLLRISVRGTGASTFSRLLTVCR